MRILIYGAGVIGSLYACLFAKAGIDTSVYARGRRLQALKENGLRYKAGREIHTADVHVLGMLDDNDIYDYILLAVREHQAAQALQELSRNQSPVIVTMVNTLQNYREWEKICGTGRILPAFPGAGGSIDDGILDAALTPALVQPTTLAEISGERTSRLRTFVQILKKAGIPYEITKDMQMWQVCHLALVVPLADAYYEAEDPEHAGSDKALMRKTAERIRTNLDHLQEMGVTILPKKLRILQKIPVSITAEALSAVYNSRFGDTFMYRHSLKAPDEMRELHEQFYTYIGEK